jgi:hypothetical protein
MSVVPFAEQHPHVPSVVQVRLVATRANADNLPVGPHPARRGGVSVAVMICWKREENVLHCNLNDGLREEACQPG